MIISHQICADLRIDPGEGWGAVAPVCPPSRGDATVLLTWPNMNVVRCP